MKIYHYKNFGIECYYEYICKKYDLYYSGRVLYLITDYVLTIGQPYLFYISGSKLLEGKELDKLNKLRTFS